MWKCGTGGGSLACLQASFCWKDSCGCNPSRPPISLGRRSGSDWRRISGITLFQVVSILTTTGFGTRDIATPYFGEAARQLFLVMMVIGGCVGSTGGGIKVLRVVILNKLIRREVFRLRVPSNAITTIVVDGKVIELDEIRRVAALFSCWMILLVFGGMVTEFLSHHSGYAAYSGMFSAMEMWVRVTSRWKTLASYTP